MKKLVSILATTAGIVLGVQANAQRPKITQPIEKHYYEGSIEVWEYYGHDQYGKKTKVIHKYNPETNSESVVSSLVRDSPNSKTQNINNQTKSYNHPKNIQTNSYPQKKVHYNNYSNNNYSNNNNISLEDKIEIGAAILGGTIWLINKLSNPRRKNYSSEAYEKTNTDYSFNVKKNNYPDNFWNEKEENNSNIWGEDANDNEDTINFWGEKKKDISNFKKDFNDAMKGDKKVYIKYLRPIAEKVAKKAVDKKIPGGDMVYEVVKNGPNDFWLKKVKDSEKILGKFKDKKDETAGGIEMIIDDFTGNYRKKVYDITESSLKFWGDVKGEKIKKKYGENSKEYLNYKIYGTTSEPIGY